MFSSSTSHLSEPDYFIRCRREWLEPEYRLRILKEKLSGEISRRSIICLQEVSTNWASSLHTFFFENGYYFVTGLYGKRFDGRMGVGIAVPTDVYSLIETDITTLTESKAMNDHYERHKKNISVSGEKRAGLKDRAVTNNFTLSECKEMGQKPFSSWIQQLREKLSGGSSSSTTQKRLTTLNPPLRFPGKPGNNYFVGTPDAEAIIWHEALKRQNQVVSVRLKTKGQNGDASKTFCLSTYHMPCSFRMPAVMLIHTVLLLQHVQGFARKHSDHWDPHIIAGDFNLMPSSFLYNLITSNKYNLVDGVNELVHCDNTVSPQLDDVVQLFRVGVNPPSVSETSDTSCSNVPQMLIRSFDWRVDSFSTSSKALYRSAYRECTGSEPSFTNYAYTKNNVGSGGNQDATRLNKSIVDEPFVETLDYIFHSPHWKVVTVKKILNREHFEMEQFEGSAGSLPSKQEPSDHLMISADFLLQQ